MKAARLKELIKIDGVRVMFFPDFSAEVQRQRKLFGLDWIGFNLLSLLEYRYRGKEMARKDEDYSIT